jgi:lipopolysaccharide export system ATP-binding protein
MEGELMQENNGKVLTRTDGLVKIYGGRAVVNGVDIAVNRGEIVGLLGPNGAGKTTTFYMIVGLIRPNSGTVFFQEKDITGLPTCKRARMGISYLSQEPSIFRKLTVEQNIMSILETLPLSRAQRKTRLEELLNELGIAHLAKQKAYTLSGGERRRLEISRALVTSPSFMLLDEPFSGVDPIAVFDVQQIIANLKAKGLGILLTDHSVRETLTITDRSYLIYEGKVLTHGTSDFLISDPEARRFYLGERFEM